MKNNLKLIATIICFTLSSAAAHAATKFWDLDGATSGAGGATPAGIWDILTANWSLDPAGELAATTWIAGDEAVFSAGTNATGAFTITVDTTQTAANLTVEEGTVTFSGGTALNIGGGVAGMGNIQIASGLTTTIGSVLTGGDDAGKIMKTGGGTLVLNAANTFGGIVTVAGGVLAIGNAAALASSLSPTIVSNGATLQLNSALTVSEPITLYGAGSNNLGAFRSVGSGNRTWSGKVTLGADARIEHTGGGNMVFTTSQLDGFSNPNGFANLTVGGNGSLVRFNINANPGINLGTGTLIKEGTCELRFDEYWPMIGPCASQSCFNWCVIIRKHPSVLMYPSTPRAREFASS